MEGPLLLFPTILWHKWEATSILFHLLTENNNHFHFLGYFNQHQTQVSKATSPYCTASCVPEKVLLSNDYFFGTTKCFLHILQRASTCPSYFLSIVYSVVLDTSPLRISGCSSICKLYWLNFKNSPRIQSPIATHNFRQKLFFSFVHSFSFQGLEYHLGC